MYISILTLLQLQGIAARASAEYMVIMVPKKAMEAWPPYVMQSQLMKEVVNHLFHNTPDQMALKIGGYFQTGLAGKPFPFEPSKFLQQSQVH